ncbi:MAG: aminotransferase class III-fold pyridoxal phosphate-dependent enzyme, partial [Ilumatobacter sp.]|nr:aminotransferase class III-fold pyridoxal phosphate-dependent enzyme [Ilumatobacter sp.]
MTGPGARASVARVTSTTSELADRYRRVLPSFLSPYYAEPLAIEHGEGSYVFDVDGQRYLDFFGGVLTTMIGHHHPAVTKAVQAQAEKVMHTSTLYLSEPMIEFAEMVAEVSGIPDARVYFTPSGSEANDAAL